jgi:hypothetical protein
MTTMTMPSVQRSTRELRTAKRHARGLRVQWRVLGARDYTFHEGTTANISTTGMALLVDEDCKPGTVLMVQPLGVDAKLAETRLLTITWSCLQMNNQWRVGGSFSLPYKEEELRALLAAAPAGSPGSPQTLMPSGKTRDIADIRRERRGATRGDGRSAPVFLSRAEGIATVYTGIVVDRSSMGLGLLTSIPFARGTQLKMRRRGAREGDAPVLLQVRYYRQKGNQWFLGCQLSANAPRVFAEWDR